MKDFILRIILTIIMILCATTYSHAERVIIAENCYYYGEDNLNYIELNYSKRGIYCKKFTKQH